MTVPLLQTTHGQGRWDFRFWPFFRQVFRFFHRETLVFGFCACYGFWFFLILAFGFCFFGQNTSGFSDLVSNAVFGFACLVSGFLNRERLRN